MNQAGSSSNEISDVDVYENSNLVYSAEVKDKAFTIRDVEHAVTKVAAAGHPSLIFIKGPCGILTEGSEEDLIQHWNDKGIDLYFISILDYFKSIISVTQNIDFEKFMDLMNTHADAAKVKDDTFTHLVECAKF